MDQEHVGKMTRDPSCHAAPARATAARLRSFDGSNHIRSNQIARSSVLVHQANAANEAVGVYARAER